MFQGTKLVIFFELEKDMVKKVMILWILLVLLVSLLVLMVVLLVHNFRGIRENNLMIVV